MKIFIQIISTVIAGAITANVVVLWNMNERLARMETNLAPLVEQYHANHIIRR